VSGNPKWVRARNEYINRMDAELNPRNFEYGFSKVKYLYAAAFDLENILNDPNGIDPYRIANVLGILENRVKELRVWEKLKQEDWNLHNATT